MIPKSSERFLRLPGPLIRHPRSDFVTCLYNSFYGSYRSSLDSYQSVFLPSEACFDLFPEGSFANEAHITQITHPGSYYRLVWLEEVVEDSLIHGDE